MTKEHQAFPLAWPVGWDRWRGAREWARFDRSMSLAKAAPFLLDELRRAGVTDWSVVISTNVSLRLDGLPYSNQKAPEDPGVAVYFTRRGTKIVLACDKWNRVEHNVRAIAAHVEAMRGQDRWGVGTLDRAFTGYAALSDPDAAVDWRDVLGLDDSATIAAAEGRYRELAMKHHPDRGGDARTMDRVAKAIKQFREERTEWTT